MPTHPTHTLLVHIMPTQAYVGTVRRSKTRQGPIKAEYVRGIMKLRQLLSLATSTGKELAVVSSASAASLVAAASNTSVAKLEKKLKAFEKKNGVMARWGEGQLRYNKGLKALKAWEVQR